MDRDLRREDARCNVWIPHVFRLPGSEELCRSEFVLVVRAWNHKKRANRTHLDQHPRLHQLQKRRGVAGAVERLPKALRTNPTDERFDLKAQILKK